MPLPLQDPLTIALYISYHIDCIEVDGVKIKDLETNKTDRAVVPRCVYITKKQHDFLKKHDINFSDAVRRVIDELMEGEK